jgi:hypothetical protein
MENNPRKPGLNRLVVSGGKRAEPRLMMAHPDPNLRRRRIGEALACALILGFIFVALFVVPR